jgi:hypothetical protein
LKTRCPHTLETSELNAEIALQDFRLRFDFQCRAFVSEVAIIYDVDALRQRKRRRQILLNHDNGLARRSKIAASCLVCTENSIRVDGMTESPKLAE